MGTNRFKVQKTLEGFKLFQTMNKGLIKQNDHYLFFLNKEV